MQRVLIALASSLLGQTGLAGEPLIAPAEQSQLSEAHQQLFDYLKADDNDGKKPLHMLGTVANHPELFEVFLPMATQLGANTTLSPRLLEILALRTAYQAKSGYEWAHHYDYGLDAGLSADEIADLAEDEPVRDWPARERLLIEAADQLVSQVGLDQTTMEDLLAAYSRKEVIEIIFIVNQYNSLSKFANSLNMQLEAGYEQAK